MHWLRYDGFLCQTLGKVTDCLCLSLLWIISCIPIVTVGAATTAMYYTIKKVVRYGITGILREYWHSFRSNFKQATLIWLMLVLIYGLLAISCYGTYVLYSAGYLPKALMVFLLLLVSAVTMWAIYLFPCLARFNNATKQIMKNCAWLAILNFPWTILLAAIFLLTIAAIALIPIGLFLFPAGGMLISSYILERVFRKYMSPEDLAEDNLYSGKITVED